MFLVRGVETLQCSVSTNLPGNLPCRSKKLSGMPFQKFVDSRKAGLWLGLKKKVRTLYLFYFDLRNIFAEIGKTRGGNYPVACGLKIKAGNQYFREQLPHIHLIDNSQPVIHNIRGDTGMHAPPQRCKRFRIFSAHKKSE